MIFESHTCLLVYTLVCLCTHVCVCVHSTRPPETPATQPYVSPPPPPPLAPAAPVFDEEKRAGKKNKNTKHKTENTKQKAKMSTEKPEARNQKPQTTICNKPQTTICNKPQTTNQQQGISEHIKHQPQFPNLKSQNRTQPHAPSTPTSQQ